MGFAVNAIYYQIPIARYERVAGHYDLVEESSQSTAAFSGAFVVAIDVDRAHRYGHFVGALSFAETFENDGFSNDAAGTSKVTEDGVIPFVGGGYAVDFDPMRASLLGFVPLRQAEIHYGPSFLLTLGAVFGPGGA